MPLATLAGEIDIINKLKEIPGVDVMEGDYVDDSYLPEVDSNKLFKPYILVKFNGSFQEYDNGICGPDKDTQRATITVYCVSPEDRVTRTIRDQVRVKMLTNFRPTDGGPLRPGNAFSFVDPDLGYHRYVHALAYTYTFNLS